MKRKIRPIKTVGALLMGVLLTASMLGGTFAKYVSAGSGSDAARVAKWGVVVETNPGSVFSNEYAYDVEGYEDKTHGSVYNPTDKLVAPGTKGSIDFDISGQPETACKLVANFESKKDVFVKYNCNEAKCDDRYPNENSKEYHPIIFTLYDNKNDIKLAEGTLQDIEEEFNAISKEFEAGEEIDSSYTLSWKWIFYVNDATDVLDTYLGNVAAGTINDPDCSTDIAFDYDISVTQID